MYFSLYNPCHSPIDAYCPIHLTSKRHRGTEHVCPRSFPPWENIDSARSESHVCKFRRSSRIVRARHLFGQCFFDFRVPLPSHYPSPGILPRREKGCVALCLDLRRLGLTIDRYAIEALCAAKSNVPKGRRRNNTSFIRPRSWGMQGAGVQMF